MITNKKSRKLNKRRSSRYNIVSMIVIDQQGLILVINSDYAFTGRKISRWKGCE